MVDISSVENMVDNVKFGIFGGESTSISGSLKDAIDLYPEENHSFPITKTKYPVEDGSSRSDNFVVEPEKIILRGLVSDLHPYAFGLVQISDKSRGKEAWGRVRELKKSGELVEVITMLGLYRNMMVVGADAVVNKDTGHSLSFTITLEETQIAETKTVQLAPVKLNDPADTKGSDIKGGKKQAEEVTSTTLLKVLKDKAEELAGGFFN